MQTCNKNARQSFLGEGSDEVMRAARVAVIGVCGGGSHVSQQCAHVGIGNFLLLDGDYTDFPNLNRMVGSEPAHANDKTPKVKVIHDLILRINPAAVVDVRQTDWRDSHERLRACDIVFGCLDSFQARDELERYCRRYLLPLIDIGMTVTSTGGHHVISGQIVTSLPGYPCMRCLGFLTDSLISDEVNRYGHAGNRPQVIWPNGVLASTAVGLAVRLLTPWHTAPLPLYLEYDGNSSTVSQSRMTAGAEWKCCRHFTPAQDIGDVFWTPHIEGGNVCRAR